MKAMKGLAVAAMVGSLGCASLPKMRSGVPITIDTSFGTPRYQQDGRGIDPSDMASKLDHEPRSSSYVKGSRALYVLSMKKIELLFLLAAAALVLLGCGSTVKVLHLHSDPALTLKHLEKGRVAVLPALSTTPLMDADALARVRGQLASGMSRARPTITQIEGARIDGSLRERPQFKPALQRYARTLAISREDLQQIGAATGARYVAFAVFDEYSFGWGEPAVIEYRKQDPAGPAEKALAYVGANPRVDLGSSMVAAGLLIMASSDPSRRLRPQPTMAEVTGRAYAQLAGTLSVFDALDGRAVWVGAAAVMDSIAETAEVSLEGRKLSSADVPAPKPPDLATLSSCFFDELLALWPK